MAEREGAFYLDVVAALAADAEHGIVGFRDLYDYVHFTPQGAVRVAQALYERIAALGLGTPRAGFDSRAYARQELERLAELESDFPAWDEWLGIGFDRARLADRDLWKYDRLKAELDARIAEAPDDALARVYRGNARALSADGRAGAIEDYEAALALRDDPVVQANLERVQTDFPE